MGPHGRTYNSSRSASIRVLFQYVLLCPATRPRSRSPFPLKMIEVDDDLTMVSDEAIDVFNMHFTVREGVTLTFGVPAVTLA